MIYLAGSIVLTSYLTLSFKMLQRLGINSFQAIVFNYPACVITGSLVNGHFPSLSVAVHQPWFPWAMLMGAAFIAILSLLAFTTKRLGISVATVANKLSLVIPFLFSIYLYKEQISWLKTVGILFALAAVWLTSLPSKNNSETSTGRKNIIFFLILPAALFLSSGLLDTLIKFNEQRWLTGANNNDFLILVFGSAGVIGISILLIRAMAFTSPINPKAVLAGICIGVPNYFSLWCLLKVLKMYTGNSSAIIPVNNMGIVLFSALAAVLLFKEKISFLNIGGILLAVAAIACIAFG